MTTQRRIYVACLASYNNAILHGAWIDASQSADAIQDEVDAMLKASPVEDAEEWAIHDHEGLGSHVEEWTSFEEISELADFLDEAPNEEAALAVLSYHGGDLSSAQERMQEYCGCFEREGDYAYSLAEDTGDLESIPEPYRNYIDWASMEQDMSLSGDVLVIETGYQERHVFWAH